MLLWSSAYFFFKIDSFKKSFYEHNQSVKRRIDVLSVTIWVQTVCKVYQLATKVAASKLRVKKPEWHPKYNIVKLDPFIILIR